jgi:hypothetical protein
MIQTMPQIASGDTPQAGSRRTIPYDYAFRYELTGEKGRVLKSTVTVSIEAPFVAVSIGYGVIPKVTPINFSPAAQEIIFLSAGGNEIRAITLGRIVDGLEQALRETSNTLKGETGAEAVLKNGFKLNPELAEFALLGLKGNAPLSASILRDLFQVVGSPPEQIQFLYAIFD